MSKPSDVENVIRPFAHLFQFFSTVAHYYMLIPFHLMGLGDVLKKCKFNFYSFIIT